MSGDISGLFGIIMVLLLFSKYLKQIHNFMDSQLNYIGNLQIQKHQFSKLIFLHINKAQSKQWRVSNYYNASRCPNTLLNKTHYLRFTLLKYIRTSPQNNKLMNTLKISYPPNTTIQQKLFFTIDRLSKMKCSSVLTQSIDSKLYPDYNTIVPHKLSFQDLKNKICSGKYQYSYEIYQDLKSLAKNHFTYFKGKLNQAQMLKNVGKFIKALDTIWEAFKEELKICNIDYDQKLVNDSQLESKINEMEELIKLSLLKKKLERMGMSPIEQNKQVIKPIQNKENSKEKRYIQVQQQKFKSIQQQCIPLKINIEVFDEKKQKSLRSKNKSKSQFIPQTKIFNNKSQTKKTVCIEQQTKNELKANKSLKLQISNDKNNKSHKIKNNLKYEQSQTQIRQNNTKTSKKYNNQIKQHKRSRRKAFKINQNIKVYNIDQDQSIQPTMILTTMKKYSSNQPNINVVNVQNTPNSHDKQQYSNLNQKKQQQILNKINKNNHQYQYQQQQQQQQIQINNIYFQKDQQSKHHNNNNNHKYYNDQHQSNQKQQQDSNTNTLSLNIVKRQENIVKIQQQQHKYLLEKGKRRNSQQRQNIYDDHGNGNGYDQNQNQQIIIQNQCQQTEDIGRNKKSDDRFQLNGKQNQQQQGQQVDNNQSGQGQHAQENKIQPMKAGKKVKKARRGRKKKQKNKINKVKIQNYVKFQAKQNKQVSKQVVNQSQNLHQTPKQNEDKDNQNNDESVQQVQKQDVKQQQYHKNSQIQLNPQQIQQQLQKLIRYKLRKYQIIVKNLLQWLHLNIIKNILGPPILKCQIHNALENDQQQDEQSKKLCYDCIQYEKQLKLYQSVLNMRTPKYLQQCVTQQIQNVIKGEINLKIILKLLKQFNLWVKLISGSYLEWRVKQQYIAVQGNIIRCLQKIIEYKKLGPDFKQLINKRKEQNRQQYRFKPVNTIKTRSKRNTTQYLNTSFNDQQQYYNLIEDCRKNRQKQIMRLKINEKYNIADSLNNKNQQSNQSRRKSKFSSEVSQQYEQFIKMLEDDQIYNDFKVVIVRDFDEPNKLKIMNKKEQKQRKRRLLGRRGRIRNQQLKNMYQQQDPYDKQTDLDYDLPRKYVKKHSHEKIARKSRLAILQQEKQQRKRRQQQEWQKDDQFLYKYSLRSNVLVIEKYQEKLQINWDEILERKLGPLPGYISLEDENTDVTRNYQGEGIQKYL